MKKQFKIIILIAMCLVVAGIYLGKNINFKGQSQKENNKLESQKKDDGKKNEILNAPSLLEFSTAT